VGEVVLREDIDERGEAGFSPWSKEEIDLLAGEAAELVAGDGFDEPDNS